MYLTWKTLVTFVVVVVVLVLVNVLSGDGPALAQAPPTACYATVTATNVPGATGPTWNKTARFYVYVWNWTVNFTCPGGDYSLCYVCEAAGGTYSTNGGGSWTPYSDGSSTTAPQTCGSAYQAAWTTTLNATAGGLYDITFSYDAFTPNEDGGCGGNGYIVAKQIFSLAVPSPP
jgi:hypothetical protein